MARKSKSQKRLEREREHQAYMESLPMLPEGAYFDDEDMLRLADGRYLADGVYRTPGGGQLLYEGIFHLRSLRKDVPETVTVKKE